MISPKFYLKDNHSEKPTPILLTFKHSKKTFRLSTERLILPNLWDRETQRPTKNPSILKEWKAADANIKAQLQSITSDLNNLENACIVEFESLKRENKSVDLSLLKERLKMQFSTFVTKASKDNEDTLNMYIDSFIQGISDGSRLIQSGSSQGKRYADSTIKSIKEWKNQWVFFQKYERKVFNWDDIDSSFIDRFISFFVSKDNSMNTIGKHVKNLKSILAYAHKEKKHTNLEYINFPVFKTDITRVVLDEHELNLLKNYEFESEEIRKDVDIFLVGCYTAMRFSDYVRVKEKYIYKEGGISYIKMISTKGKQSLNIPIGAKLHSILSKYDYNLPKTNAQRLNKNIKEACKIVGINQPIEVKKVKGGREIIEHLPKYLLVQSHTARRSGATNLLKSGVQALMIMKITGHKKESSFMKYIVLDSHETARLLIDNSYLN